jgi:hypothetical protein
MALAVLLVAVLLEAVVAVLLAVVVDAVLLVAVLAVLLVAAAGTMICVRSLVLYSFNSLRCCCNVVANCSAY